MTPSKRLLLAIGLILVTIGLGIALYMVFFRGPTAPTPSAPTSGTDAPQTGLPTADPGTPSAGGTPRPTPGVLPTIPTIAAGGPTATTRVTEGVVHSPVLGPDGTTLTYYSQEDGRFYRVGPDGTPVRLSSQQFFNVETIAWSRNADRAVLEFPDGVNVLFDFSASRQVTLPKHWEEFEFSPGGTQIAAKSIGLSPSNRWLITSEADGSRAKTIAPLGENADKVQVSWSPNDEVVAFSQTGSAQGLNTSEILLIGKQNENLKSLLVEGRDFRPNWSPDGRRVLYSAYSEQNGLRPMLWIVDARGDDIGANRQRLGVETWADKCTFSGTTVIYCAVPDNIPEGYGLQPRLRDQLTDYILRIDIASGTKTRIGSPVPPTGIEQINVSSDGKFLYYIDIRTSELQKMQLK